MYVLDTDHLTILQYDAGEERERLARRMAGSDGAMFVTIVSFHEQVVGWHGYLNSATGPRLVHGYERLQRVLDDFAGLDVLPFDASAERWYHRIRSQKLRCGVMDLRIASIVLANGMTLLTRNASDFSGIPGLSVADWTTGDSDHSGTDSDIALL